MKISISKQQLSILPPAHYTGKIVVVDHPDSVESAVDQLQAAELIGFDTETRPAFKKGQSHNVALLQLAASDVCYLFRLNKIGMPEKIKALLEDPAKKKIGLSTHDDFRNLRKICDIKPDGFIELQEYVGRWNIIDKSLSKLYGILFGKRLSKSQRLSNWEAEDLAESQLHYAALDARACVEIYQYLENGNFDPASSRFILEEKSNSEE